MKPETFENHPLFEKLEQLINRLNEDECREKIELERVSFFESTARYVSDRIKLTIPILVQEAEMNALSSEIDAGLQQINAFLGNNNEGHLNNATNNFNSALNRIRNFPLPFSKNDFNFSKAVSEFQKIVKEKYQELEKENKELETQLTDFQTDLESKDVEIKRLFKLLESKETEIQNLNSSFQTSFDNIKASATQNYEQDRKTFRTEFDTKKEVLTEEISALKNSIDVDSDQIIKDLNTKLEEANKIVGVVSDRAVTGNYQNIANSHKTTADIFRIIAILLMIGLSSILIYTIWDISGDSFDWTKSLIRILAAAALSYPATYAARESSKHRKLEIQNRKAELELTAIGPFIELLPEEKKQQIKEKLVDKYFGGNSIVDPSDDGKQEDVSISSLERIMKSILPFLKQ
ncbi:MAG: hypothetical protein ABJG41_16170 [Cyclobacteriaceae bacterium]